MGTMPAQELLNLWKLEAVTPEMVTGHLTKPGQIPGRPDGNQNSASQTPGHAGATPGQC